MKGSPGWQAILIFVVFALTGLPVWRLTRSAPAAPAPAADVSAPASQRPDPPQTLAVEAVFAPPPHDFRVECLGQTVLEGHGPGSSFKTSWTTSIPAEGVDLVVRAGWTSPDTAPPAGSAAARVTVHLPDGRTVDRSFWAAADGSLAEVFPVPGASAAP